MGFLLHEKSGCKTAVAQGDSVGGFADKVSVDVSAGVLLTYGLPMQ